ncbi:MAG: hypothetical protein HZB38_06880 [Planctomycetes bacterium]|nr:hypothetical protein [Planctomycetota bacterium]
MGHPTKVQVIQREASEQWYVNFPAAVAHAFEFEKGEVVEWTVQDRHTLILTRVQAAAAAPARKKKR